MTMMMRLMAPVALSQWQLGQALGVKYHCEAVAEEDLLQIPYGRMQGALGTIE